MRTLLSSVVATLATTMGCSTPAEVDESPPASSSERPERFTIAPDDYHVPYAGTAEDGRRFFLSDELFDAETGFVGLFLWNPDGSFAEVRVDRVRRPRGLPPGQAGSAGADDLVAKRLRELGGYTLEPITVEPFLTVVDGVAFGWEVEQYEDGTWFIGICPGDFIVYYEPWDGLEYDT
ncbi:MAG TPA: hypothetical protein VM575_06430 [Nocardioides sp.]|nr:hypothetical protein [Nocardioides sp.]